METTYSKILVYWSSFVRCVPITDREYRAILERFQKTFTERQNAEKAVIDACIGLTIQEQVDRYKQLELSPVLHLPQSNLFFLDIPRRTRSKNKHMFDSTNEEERQKILQDADAYLLKLGISQEDLNKAIKGIQAMKEAIENGASKEELEALINTGMMHAMKAVGLDPLMSLEEAQAKNLEHTLERILSCVQQAIGVDRFLAMHFRCLGGKQEATEDSDEIYFDIMYTIYQKIGLDRFMSVCNRVIYKVMVQ